MAELITPFFAEFSDFQLSTVHGVVITLIAPSGVNVVNSVKDDVFLDMSTSCLCT